VWVKPWQGHAVDLDLKIEVRYLTRPKVLHVEPDNIPLGVSGGIVNSSPTNW
jgi:hypothetical protein